MSNPPGQAVLLDELQRNRRMLAEAQQLARIGSWEWDVAENRVVWSDELFRIYGYTPQAFEPSYETFLSHVHSDDRESVDARNHKAFADHQAFEDVKRVVRADGSEIHMRTRGEVLIAPDGTVMRMLGVCEDVTDKLRAEEAQALLAAIVRCSNDAIYTITADGAITTWNPAATRLFGYAEDEAIGMPCGWLAEAQDAAREATLVAAAFKAQLVEPWEAARRRKDGEQVAVSLALSPIRDAQGRVSSVSVIARDVSERHRFEAQLRHLADHDPLTGVHNRRRFEDELERAVAYATRYGTGGALFVLDFDNFRFLNDGLGHRTGDDLLRSVAGALRGRLRSTDVIARTGGDEFAIVIPHADADVARTAAHGLVNAVRRHEMTVDDRPVHVTASVGGVLLDDAEGSGETAMFRAMAALRAAKEAGHDRAILFAPGQAAELGPRSDWERRIAVALEKRSFQLYVQPILALNDKGGDLRRYEALLRMTDDGIVLPGAFLPAAERSGQIHAIDRWVVSESVDLLARHDDLELEINVSARSLDDAELTAHIATELERSGADPGRLIIEITETATIANMEDARRFAAELAGLGCRFAIDDFGAGFGSFSYLKHLPAAFLKIDGDFVQAPRSRTDELVINAIVGMARGLGKETIAEFVDDDECVEMLRAAGVDYAQGYHVGRPFPATEL
jgi:diguanylate cyclase (GGDEF)-like protein/PAS domain S-box-containing protein